MVQQKVVTLLSDSENIVKQSLMENGITRLCVFFGRQKANDVLLSHMITFLNDKNDWHLRGAFFDSIVGERGRGREERERERLSVRCISRTSVNTLSPFYSILFYSNLA